MCSKLFPQTSKVTSCGVIFWYHLVVLSCGVILGVSSCSVILWCHLVMCYFPRPGQCHLLVPPRGVILWCVVSYLPRPGRCHLASAFLPTFPWPRLGQNNKSSMVSISEDIHTQRREGK